MDHGALPGHRPKDSQICNEPNDWAIEHDQPRYILDLLKQIVTVSVETVKIVGLSLAPLSSGSSFDARSEVGS